MAKQKDSTATPLVRDLFQYGLYKRSQGKIVRQVTFAAVAVLALLAGWRLSAYAGPNAGPLWHWMLPAIVGAGGTWAAYRLVNRPAFADFLIAVEAELNKVSWPSKAELIRSSLVVIFCMGFLTLVLYGYDVALAFILRWILA